MRQEFGCCFGVREVLVNAKLPKGRLIVLRKLLQRRFRKASVLPEGLSRHQTQNGVLRFNDRPNSITGHFIEGGKQHSLRTVNTACSNSSFVFFGDEVDGVLDLDHPTVRHV